MANIEGSIVLTGFIAPSHQDDTYATQDETYNRGGYRTVNTLIEKNNIPIDRQKPGMLVFVIENNTTYRLKPDNTWEEFISNSSTNINTLTEVLTKNNNGGNKSITNINSVLINDQLIVGGPQTTNVTAYFKVPSITTGVFSELTITGCIDSTPVNTLNNDSKFNGVYSAITLEQYRLKYGAWTGTPNNDLPVDNTGKYIYEHNLSIPSDAILIMNVASIWIITDDISPGVWTDSKYGITNIKPIGSFWNTTRLDNENAAGICISTGTKMFNNDGSSENTAITTNVGIETNGDMIVKEQLMTNKLLIDNNFRIEYNEEIPVFDTNINNIESYIFKQQAINKFKILNNGGLESFWGTNYVPLNTHLINKKYCDDTYLKLIDYSTEGTAATQSLTEILTVSNNGGLKGLSNIGSITSHINNNKYSLSESSGLSIQLDGADGNTTRILQMLYNTITFKNGNGLTISDLTFNENGTLSCNTAETLNYNVFTNNNIITKKQLDEKFNLMTQNYKSAINSNATEGYLNALIIPDPNSNNINIIENNNALVFNINTSTGTAGQILSIDTDNTNNTKWINNISSGSSGGGIKQQFHFMIHNEISYSVATNSELILFPPMGSGNKEIVESPNNSQAYNVTTGYPIIATGSITKIHLNCNNHWNSGVFNIYMRQGVGATSVNRNIPIATMSSGISSYTLITLDTPYIVTQGNNLIISIINTTNTFSFENVSLTFISE